ncbi:MAG TPA: hypothetical protein VM487_17910 [Phycisphaerae bacterium]|nr:hypothetical protein [Phycisphaerae bacterium]
MNRKAIGHLAAGVVALLLLIDSATAQYEYLGSRTLAPSTYVGRVGRPGGFRTPQAVFRPTWGGAAATLGTGALGGRSGLGGVMLTGLPAAVTPGQPGVYVRPTPGLYGASTGRTAPRSLLSGISRFSSAISYGTPLTRAQWNYLPEPTTPLYAAKPQPSVFHEFFGLRPSEPSPTELDAAPIESLAALMQEDTQQRVREMESRAQEFFKQATRAEVEDRQEKLARAIDLFQAVNQLDKEAYLPSLLTIHAAIERDQLLLASRALFTTVRRRPEVFGEEPDIREYFGDPSRLETQARKYLRVGDDNPEIPQAYALQAYCAWVLGDRARATQALRLADENSRGEREHGRIRTFKAALEAALR